MAGDVQCMKKDYVGLKQQTELLVKSSDTDSDSEDTDSITCASHAQDISNTLTDIPTHTLTDTHSTQRYEQQPYYCVL